MKKHIIGLVDDDHIYQMIARKALMYTGLSREVLAFSDGEEALEYLRENRENAGILPDVIFLDINMPYVDGWDFLEAYSSLKKKLPKKVTIYIVSSSISEQDIHRARNITEVQEYLTKPVTIDQFQEILRKI